MSKQNSKAENLKNEREKVARRRRRIWAIAQTIARPWIVRKFNLSIADFDPAKIEGPILVAINHSCAYDPILVGAAFKNRMLTFIASEHILRMRPWGPILDSCCSIIPHQKGAKGSRTALVAMKRIKRGESIFLAVEGEQTWDGLSLPIMPYTGKLVKGSGATLVTYMIEGGYLSAPRWASNVRKGKVYGHPVNIYSPEKIKGMSDEEVEAAIAKDLWLDIWEWQKSQPGGPISYVPAKGGSADGLERAVFTCPSCGSFGTLKAEGDTIGCECGFKVRLSDTGFFDPAEPFETVADWMRHDRAAFKDKLASFAEKNEAGEQVVFSDGDITLTKIGDGHEEEWTEKGQVSLLHRDGEFILCASGHEFRLKGISAMTMVLAVRIVFCDKSGYYELKSKKGSRTNLRKYIIVWGMLSAEADFR